MFRLLKNARVVIPLLIVLCCISAGAVLMTDVFMSEDEIDTADEFTDVRSENAARKALIDTALEELPNTDTADKYDIMLAVLDATIENPIEFNDAVHNYEYLKRVYKPSDDELDYIADLIIEGCAAMDIMDIAYFWTDTNEDISIIGEIYKYKGRYKGGTWIENAFNKVTGDKCGVLDDEDVDRYIHEGLTLEDITAANKLCRRGVLTIQEILEMRKDGKTFAEISAVTEGISADELPQAAKARVLTNEAEAAVMSAADETAEKADAEYADVVSSAEVLDIERLARIEGGDPAEYYQMAADGENISELLDKADEEVSDEIDAELREKNIYKTVTREQREEYSERRAADYE